MKKRVFAMLLAATLCVGLLPTNAYAGLDARKCNPRALHSLYQRTQEEITQQLMSLHMQEYEKLLDQDEKKVG